MLRKHAIEEGMGKTMMKLEIELQAVSGGTLDSFQALRSSIMYMNDTKVISFTSTTPLEGKSVLSFYTAVSFASLNKKTLFIDCDMRKSHINRYFNVKTKQNKIFGLSEYVSGQSEDLIYETNYPNLYMIPSGKCPPDPSGILSSVTFEKVLQTAAERTRSNGTFGTGATESTTVPKVHPYQYHSFS